MIQIDRIMLYNLKKIDNYLKLKEKIEDYLDGRLSNEEQKSFELAMYKDPALAKKVRIVQEINNTISTERQFQEYQKKITIFGNQYFETSDETEKVATIRQLPNNNRKVWLIAASVLVLIVSSVLIWNVLKTETVNSADLFASNYEPYNIGQRGENDNLTDLEKEAVEAYNAKKYESAIPLLQQLIAINSNNEPAILQLGSAYTATKQTEKAITAFQKISDSSINYQVAQWYLALAYLQNNQIEKAKQTLTKLAKLGERTYPTKAKELLEKL